MNWVWLAMRNLGRRRLRSAVTATGVAIAVAALFSLIAFQRGYRAGMQGELDRLGAHILVAPKGCPYDAASIALHGASWPCYLKASYMDQLRQTPGVQTVAPLLMNAIMDQSTGEQSVYLGAEPSLLALKRGWQLQGDFPSHDGDCLIGARVAQNLRLHAGQTFALPALNGQTGRVCGVLAPTQGADDTFIFLTLADAQRRFKRPGQLTHALIRLTDPNQMDTVVAALRGCDAGLDMNVVPLTHLFRSIQDLVNTTRALLAAVLLVALLVAGAGVSNTVLMAVTERTREIGVLRAIGASPADIFRLIWLETVQVCLAGGLAGVLIAAICAPRVETWLRERLPFAPSGTLVHAEPGVVLACLAGALLLGSVAGLLPAWRAARLSPIEAIRTGQAV